MDRPVTPVGGAEAPVAPGESPTETEPPMVATSRDAPHWAKPTAKLAVGEVAAGTPTRNVVGRRVMSPIQGFGRMWQKTYRIKFGDVRVPPADVIRAWKENFASFWPDGNRFFAPLTGIAPGEVALLNLSMPGKVKLSTGVFVLYADQESFTLMTPEGHMFAGWITFSAYEDSSGTVAQAQVLMRSNDPLYEVGLSMGGHKKEDRFWEHTMRALAAHFSVDGEFSAASVCVDKKRQWKRAWNIRHNAFLRGSAYALGTPFRAAARPLRRKPRG